MLKPRYPAHLFYELRNYPRKRCENAECSALLTPRLAFGKLEALKSFKLRRWCSPRCQRVVLAEDELRRLQGLNGKAQTDVQPKEKVKKASKAQPRERAKAFERTSAPTADTERAVIVDETSTWSDIEEMASPYSPGLELTKDDIRIKLGELREMMKVFAPDTIYYSYTVQRYEQLERRLYCS